MRAVAVEPIREPRGDYMFVMAAPSADVRVLVAELQAALGVSMVCGQITLNFNNGDVDSVETRTKVRVPKQRLDKSRPRGV